MKTPLWTRKIKKDQVSHLLLDQTQVHSHGRGATTINLGKVGKHLGPAAALLTGSALREVMSLACSKSVLRVYQLKTEQPSILRPHTIVP